MAQAAIKLVKSSPVDNAHSGVGATQSHEQRDARLAKAFSDLDADLYNLSNMSYLALLAVEEALGSSNQDPTDKPHTYYLPDDQVAAVIFAVHHLDSLIMRLKKQYNDTRDGGKDG